jgi:hypothetical protein
MNIFICDEFRLVHGRYERIGAYRVNNTVVETLVFFNRHLLYN